MFYLLVSIEIPQVYEDFVAFITSHHVLGPGVRLLVSFQIKLKTKLLVALIAGEDGAVASHFAVLSQILL